MPIEEEISRLLADTGVRAAFGVPGSQNIGYFEAFEASAIDLKTTTHELAAGFAALAYGRLTGRAAVLLVIPGPGLTYAVTALAEALHDSVPMILIVRRSSVRGGPQHQLQALDEKSLLGPVTKAVIELDHEDQLGETVTRAWDEATGGIPGPVALLVDKELTAITSGKGIASSARVQEPTKNDELVGLAERMSNSDRILFFVSHLADGVSAELTAVAEMVGASVMSTPGARGVIAESHPSCLMTDQRSVEALNETLTSYDLVVVFGVRHSHSNTFGFKLRLPESKVVEITADRSASHQPFDGQQIYCRVADAVSFLSTQLAATSQKRQRRAAHTAIPLRSRSEPVLASTQPGTLAAFFDDVRRVLPKCSVVTTDSGSHQFFARRHYRAECPAGLLTPAEYQSMGFSLPAAFGAKCARPEWPVVVVMGDGGLQMCGMEMATIARYRMGIPVIVFCDGRFGLIRDQQLARFGRSVGTELPRLQLAQLAAAFDIPYEKLDNNVEAILTAALERDVPTLIEVELKDSPAQKVREKKAVAKRLVRRMLPF